MPPVVRKPIREVPPNVKPYQFHGVNVDVKDGAEDVYGDCPFCGKEGKFAVNVGNGMWRCLVCGTGTEKGGGNAYTFLRALYNVCRERTTGGEGLAGLRGFLDPSTPVAWGCCRSVIDGGWMVPGYSPDGKLNQLYRYVRIDKGMRLLATPGLNHQVHGVELFDPRKPTTFVCEGPWDGMALWEVLRNAKYGPGKLMLTSDSEQSLGSFANVVALPGCNVFPAVWASSRLFAGKDVVLLFDNDHPRENNGKTFRAGYDGMKKVAGMLASAEEPPKSIAFLRWGTDGFDPGLPDGCDVRDFLSLGESMADRVGQLDEILKKVEPIPTDWVAGRSHTQSRGGVGMDLIPCSRWAELRRQWKKAMKWTDGLEHGLTVMLASVISTLAVGDQLWVKVIGPASCGKSTLCEALSVNKKYVLAKSSIRGFHSGYQTDREGKEDNSLLAQVNGKTLVTKDGDTLLQAPNLPQILSEARDVYDRTSRTHYRNKTARDYEGVSMTWILCGTSSLRSIDSSELGERFLDCVIMHAIDEELEDEILWRVVNRSHRGMRYEVNGTPEDRQDPDMTLAMQLTGGYVDHLRTHANTLLSAVDAHESAMRRCMMLGKFVAYMRARPSLRQNETAEREFAARLTSQMIRLATCLAAVLNRQTVDDEVLGRVCRVAKDTARGKVMELCRHMARYGGKGCEVRGLGVQINESDEKTRALLRFLYAIGIAAPFGVKLHKGLAGRPRWRMTPRFVTLWNEVMGDESPCDPVGFESGEEIEIPDRP